LTLEELISRLQPTLEEGLQQRLYGDPEALVHQEIYPVDILPDPPPDVSLVDIVLTAPLSVGTYRRREGADGAARIVVLAGIARLTFGADLRTSARPG
jgi:hypothetical protein